MENNLKIENLNVCVKDSKTEDSKILNNFDLSVKKGEIHAIMGRNGSGKSTLALTLMGHPKYKITNGSIEFFGQDLIKMSIQQRSKAGIFLAFQNPIEIEGVSLREFLYQIYVDLNKNSGIEEFEKLLVQNMKLLEIKPEFVERSINFGLSGGEKKKAEILQLSILKPKLIILDEIDSGLDVDALKIICNGISKIKEQNREIAILIITHYPRILNYLEPDFVHVMEDGRIKKSGTKQLAQEIEKSGYDLK